MDIFVSTVFYDGQFWIALIERVDDDGRYSIGKYTFGPEPSNTDLLDFYLTKLSDIEFLPSDRKVKLAKVRKHPKDASERVKKSLAEFKELQSNYLLEKQCARRVEDRKADGERYREKREKKKEKRRGH
jgi:hypothetical protein